MAHRIRIDRDGGPEVLQYVTEERATPDLGEAWLRQEAIGVNFLDITQRTGAVPLVHPSGLGLEAAGVVEEVGAGVENMVVGDRVVYALGPIGAYADGHIYPANRLVKLPDFISTHDAAAIFLKGLTAHYLLTSIFHVGQGTEILLYGVSGGLGQIMAPWAKALGANVIGVVSRPEGVDRAKDAGCHEVIVWSDGDLAARVRELTNGKGVDVVYDGIGRDTFEASLDSLKKRGTMVSMGASSGVPDRISIARLNKDSLFLTRPGLLDYISDLNEYSLRSEVVFHAFRSGVIRSNISRTFPLERAREAHMAHQSGEVKGTILLVP